MSEPHFGWTVLRMFAGVLIWSAHFLLIYAFTALACTRGFESAIPYTVIGATVVGLLVLALIASRAVPARTFADWMTIAVAAIAVVAMLWEALPLFWVPVCASR
jgi:hypothetical protein